MTSSAGIPEAEQSGENVKTDVAHQAKKINDHGMLTTGDGWILKPILAPPRGERELNFYKSIFVDTSADPILVELKPFLCAFKEVVDVEGRLYMQLEDATVNCSRPCWMDFKLGAVTSDPEADRHKIERESVKYKATKKLGFCIPSMTVYDLNSCSTVFRNKDYGKTLTESNYEDVFREYFNAKFALSNPDRKQRIIEVIDDFRGKVDQLISWFESQTSYKFYASSLLLVHDAASITPRTETGKRDVVLKLIDFAHIFPSSDSTKDENVLLGLRTLRSVLVQLGQELRD